MQQLKKLYNKLYDFAIFRNPKTAILIAVLVMVAVLPLSKTFAFGTFADSLNLSFEKLFGWFLMIMSYLWFPFSKVASALMGNGFVYGEHFGLTEFLWKLWNMSKVFANFTLGFIFIAQIFKLIYSPKATPSSMVKEILPKIFFASILIQLSWFLMGALVDVANISAYTVGSFPQMFFDSSKGAQSVNKVYCKNLENISNAKSISTETESELGLDIYAADDCEENQNNVMQFGLDGALSQLGVSVFAFYGNDFDANSYSNFSFMEASFSQLYKAFIMFMFLLPLFLLIVVNFVRVVLIRIWIIASPFIVIDSLFGGKVMGSNEKFKIGNIIGLIFQPVVVTAMLGFSLIFITGMQKVILGENVVKSGEKIEQSIEKASLDANGDYKDLGLLKYKTSGRTVEFSSSYSETVFKNIGPKLGGFVGDFVGYVITSLFTIFMLWTMLKASFSTSKITANMTKGVYTFAEDLMKSARVFGGMSWSGLEKGTEMMKHNVTRQDQSKEASQAMNAIKKHLGLEANLFDQSHLESARYSLIGGTGVSKTTKFFSSVRKSIEDNGLSNVTMQNGQFSDAIKTWLSDKDVIRYIKDKNIITNEADLDKFMNGKLSFDDLLRNNSDLTGFIDEAIKGNVDFSKSNKYQEAYSVFATKNYGKK